MLKNICLWSIGLIFTLALSSCGDDGKGMQKFPFGPAGPAGADGSDGQPGSAGPGVTWEVVTGTEQQAAPDTGYLANNASEVVVTLPVSASLSVGDVVQVSGVGAGGWKIAQNAGQSITFAKEIFGPLGPPWIPRDSARDWTAVASSDDGTKLVAVAYGGQIYTSTDSGVSWTPRESNRNWQAVASSLDGTKLVAAGFNEQIYTSTDSGVSWTAREASRDWRSVASSADGTKLVAVASSDQIYTSTDSGVTWIARDPIRFWVSVASSADGTKLVAGTEGQIYTSTDSGLSWTPQGINRVWMSIASSADGTKLVAVDRNGQIYTSEQRTATTAGSPGFIRGDQNEAIGLQYIGNDAFIVISYAGALTIN